MALQDINQDLSIQRICYQGHIINLTVQDFFFKGVINTSIIKLYKEDKINGIDLNKKQRKKKEQTFRVMGVLGKLHNIVVYSRASAGYTAEFKQIVGRMIPLDNRTRQNSWFSLLNVALKVELKVNEYVKKNLKALEDDILLLQDWVNLCTIYSFLKLFY